MEGASGAIDFRFLFLPQRLDAKKGNGIMTKVKEREFKDKVEKSNKLHRSMMT